MWMRPQSSTTAWTSCRISVSRRLTFATTKASSCKRADVVFTGGHSIYEAKRDQHHNIHPFPSSVDVAHFAAARHSCPAPPDQAGIAGPVFGYYGVIDERIDLGLIAKIAATRPDWSLVMVGPVVKIDPAELPQAPQYSLSRPQGICGATRLSVGLAGRVDAIRDQRSHTVHQPN